MNVGNVGSQPRVHHVHCGHLLAPHCPPHSPYSLLACAFQPFTRASPPAHRPQTGAFTRSCPHASRPHALSVHPPGWSLLRPHQRHARRLHPNAGHSPYVLAVAVRVVLVSFVLLLASNGIGSEPQSSVIARRARYAALLH